MKFGNFFSKPRARLDEVFGKMSYTTFKNRDKNFYEGSAVFAGKKTGIIIEADETGPTVMQKNFFIKIRDSYSDLQIQHIIPFLNKNLSNFLGYELNAQNFDIEFEIDAIIIPKEVETAVEWSICYEYKKANHYLTVKLLNNTPTAVHMDG